MNTDLDSEEHVFVSQTLSFHQLISWQRLIMNHEMIMMNKSAHWNISISVLLLRLRGHHSLLAGFLIKEVKKYEEI